jgi:Tfp pilus assembly protein PilF
MESSMQKRFLSATHLVLALSLLLSAPAAFSNPTDAAPTAAATEDGVSKVRELLTQAREMIKAERIEDAIPLLETAIKYDPNPNSASVHQNLGVLYQKIGAPDKAIVQYREALKMRPAMHACTLNIGQCYLALGDNDRAIQHFRTFVKQDPESPHAPAVKEMISSLLGATAEAGGEVKSPDYLSSAAKEGVYRWPVSKLPLRVFVDPGTHVVGCKPTYDQYITQAFDQWASASGNRLAWTRVSNREQADIVCSWSDDLQFIGASEDAGQTDMASEPGPDGSRIIRHVKVAVLTISADGKPLGEQEIKRTCLHEVGHALGLKDHSPNGGDVMFFSDAPSTAPNLSSRDRATIARLYDAYPQVTARQVGSGKRG